MPPVPVPVPELFPEVDPPPPPVIPGRVLLPGRGDLESGALLRGRFPLYSEDDFVMLFSAESDEREWESVGSVPSGLATGLGAIGLYLDIMWSVLVGYMGMPVSIASTHPP